MYLAKVYVNFRLQLYVAGRRNRFVRDVLLSSGSALLQPLLDGRTRAALELLAKVEQNSV
jgi:hypothetical protein